MSSNGSRFWGVVATLGLAGMGLMFLAFVMGESQRFQVPVMPVMALVGGVAIFLVLIRGPIGQGIAHMLDSRSQPDDVSLTRIEQLESQLGDVGLDQQRFAELEDRLDFAERLLAQRNEIPALKSPERS